MYYSDHTFRIHSLTYIYKKCTDSKYRNSKISAIVKDSVANTLFFVVVCLILQPDGEYLCVNLYKKVANLDFIQYVAGKEHFKIKVIFIGIYFSVFIEKA